MNDEEPRYQRLIIAAIDGAIVILILLGILTWMEHHDMSDFIRTQQEVATAARNCLKYQSQEHCTKFANSR